AFLLLKFSRRITNGNRHDQDPTGPSHGRKARDEQQTDCRIPRVARGSGNQRDQEERRIRGTGSGPFSEVESQGAHGPQSANRRSDQDSCQGRGEVPRGQGREGRNRPQEVAPCFPQRRPAACRPFALQLSVVSCRLAVVSSQFSGAKRATPFSVRHMPMCGASLIPGDKAAYKYLIESVPCCRSVM